MGTVSSCKAAGMQDSKGHRQQQQVQCMGLHRRAIHSASVYLYRYVLDTLHPTLHMETAGGFWINQPIIVRLV